MLFTISIIINFKVGPHIISIKITNNISDDSQVSEILDADTATIGLPISIANGGTGATSAGAALINLGGTSTGIALFEAANQAAAWTALGVAQAGNVNGGTFT